MQLKLTTGYVIRMLVYLAENKRIVCSLAELSENLKISQKYLIRISVKLRDAGILETYSGSRGGFRLKKSAEEIRLYDIVLLMEGTVKLHRCLEEDHYCSQKISDRCRTLQCFAVMQKYWENFLKGITIADLTEGMSEREVEQRIFGRPAGPGGPETSPKRYRTEMIEKSGKTEWRHRNG